MKMSSKTKTKKHDYRNKNLKKTEKKRIVVELRIHFL